MVFCLSQRNNVRPFRALRVNHCNHICLKKTEANQAFIAIVLPFVFTGHGEVVPDCLSSNEVKLVILDVQLARWFVPCEHI